MYLPKLDLYSLQGRKPYCFYPLLACSGYPQNWLNGLAMNQPIYHGDVLEIPARSHMGGRQVGEFYANYAILQVENNLPLVPGKAGNL